jgi:hypothetical protein
MGPTRSGINEIESLQNKSCFSTEVYAVSGAEYFSNLLPNSECIIFEECGHIMAIDKPEDTARVILAFYDNHTNHPVKSLSGTNV